MQVDLLTLEFGDSGSRLGCSPFLRGIIIDVIGGTRIPIKDCSSKMEHPKLGVYHEYFIQFKSTVLDGSWCDFLLLFADHVLGVLSLPLAWRNGLEPSAPACYEIPKPETLNPEP